MFTPKRGRILSLILIFNLLLTSAVAANISPSAAQSATQAQPNVTMAITPPFGTITATVGLPPTETATPSFPQSPSPTFGVPATMTAIADTPTFIPTFASGTPTFASGTPTFIPTFVNSQTPTPPSSTATATPTFATPTATPTPSCALNPPDSDGDAIPDDWEVNGVPLVGGGRYDIRQMGADPCHKDIFVEADYMKGYFVYGYNQQPSEAAMAKLRQTFNSAPVGNPDGSTGIHIHIDSGPQSVMNPVSGQTWGSLSRANALRFRYHLGSFNGNDYDWSAFDTIKRGNFPHERQCVFHYALFAHLLDNVTWSGSSRGFGATDYIVSLGAFQGGIGTTNQQAGTMMHELGHNLGLHHGGADDVNYKPNYLSVMNYFFQMSGLITGAGSRFDFSPLSLSPLNETALNEPLGLGAGANGYGTRWWVGGNSRQTGNANGWIDWNGNGTPDNPAIADINGDGVLTMPLTSALDWNNLVYDGSGLLGAGCTPLAQADGGQSGPELSLEEDNRISRDYDMAVNGSGDRQLAPSASTVYTLTLVNRGTNSDVYTITTASSLGWADFSGIPTNVTLAAGQSVTYTFSVTAPANADHSMAEQSRVIATSGNDPGLQDEVSVETTVTAECGNPFVDIGGNVFYNAIHTLNCLGVVNGTDATHYSPGGSSTRAQFAKVIVLGFGLPFVTPSGGVMSFPDVPPNYFAYVYIETGYANSILSGYDPLTCAANGVTYPCFLPNRNIKRGELTKLVVNAAAYETYTPATQSFSDVPPSNVFYASIETAHFHNVVGGYPDGTFRPNNNIRRDEMAQIVYKGVTTP